MKTAPLVILSAALLAALAPTAQAGPAGSREFAVYVQQAWPKQTTTNRQIRDINRTLGTGFEDWGDIPNLSVGAQAWWPVATGLQLGAQVDFGAGAIEGAERVPTEAGIAKATFEQRYDIYADLYGVAKWKPWADLERLQPFLYGGIGVAYESDTTTLRLRNDLIDSRLRVKNDGWFPTYTAGFGVDIPFTATRHWHFEVGVAYVWARMKHHVPATGDLAPAPEVVADTDLTGPNYWLGFGRSF